MTVLEVELGVVIVLLAVLAFVCWRAAKGLVGAVYERQVAIDRMFKEVARADLRAAAEAGKAVETARNLHEDARLLNERVDRYFADPRVKRMLGG